MAVETIRGAVGEMPARQGWQWALGLCRAVLAATPGHVAGCVFLYVASQLTLLAALLLPWKILLVLSTRQFPQSLPSFLASYETRDLVLVLGAGSLVSFLLHQICEAGIGFVCSSGVSTLLDRHRKTGLFNNHRALAAQLYRRLLRSLAAIVCCALIMLWLAFAYPLLLAALATCLVFGQAAALRWNAMRIPPTFRPSSEQLTKAWWGGGFLYVLGWVIADYWQGGFPHLTIAFISLLLVRQALIFAAALYQNFRLLYEQRSRVDALFFADTPWLPPARKDDGFKTLLDTQCRKQWVRDLLSRRAGFSGRELEIRCRTAESGRIVYLTVAANDGGKDDAFLLKLYHRSRDAVSQHEEEILRVAADSWPAPRFLGSHEIEGHSCLVFGWHADRKWLSTRELSPRLLELREMLLECRLPEPLICRYDRSHPSLSRRLLEVDWSHLRSLAPSERMADLCDELRDHWPAILRELDALPRQLVLPALDRRMMAAAEGEIPVICNWNRWRWEPVGAGWPFRRRPFQQLCDVLASAGGTRSELRGVNAEQAHRAAVLFEFDQLRRSGEFDAALQLLEPICESASSIVK